MIDVPSHIRAREAELKDAGVPIAEVLRRANVDRATWTGWKHRNISPRFDTWQRAEAEIASALANPSEYAPTPSEQRETAV